MSYRMNLGTAHGRIPWPLLVSGLWLRVAISAAGIAVMGILLAFTGEASPLAGATTFVVSAVVAVFAWRRMYYLLTGKPGRRAEADAADAPRSSTASARAADVQIA